MGELPLYEARLRRLWIKITEPGFVILTKIRDFWNFISILLDFFAKLCYNCLLNKEGMWVVILNKKRNSELFFFVFRMTQEKLVATDVL